MIATLTGRVSEKLDNHIVVDVSGVGYGLLVPLETYSQAVIDKDIKLFIYEHVRENMFDLYGFSDFDTKKLFEKLLDVSGVGPKMALSILSLGTLTSVRQAIANGDAKYIQLAPGVGKKVAERVIIDLKDKVGLESSVDAASLISKVSSSNDEAVQALVSLGYSMNDAINAMKNIDRDLSVEERVTIALRSK